MIIMMVTGLSIQINEVSGDSEDDYNDVDWTLYPDKRGKWGQRG